MTPTDLQKLLGGYAAGTLTPEERRALFDAALADQTLFDALADEEALREVLADPACRERVRAALVERPPTVFWLRRPAAWTLAAATATAAVVLTVALLRTKPIPRTAPAPQQIAMAHKPAPPALVPSTPTPSPAKRTTRRAPAAAAKSEPRLVELSPPPAETESRRELPAMPGGGSAAGSGALSGMGFARKLDSPRAAIAGAVAPAPPAPPPPPATNETVTVVAASPLVAAQTASESQDQESKAISNLSIAGRDAAKLMKWMPGVFGLRYTLLRRGEGDKDVEVPPDTVFGRHESVHLRIEPAQSGYLYVLAGKQALYAGAVTANQPVLIVTRPGVLDAVFMPQPDSGPLSTVVSRARQQQLEGDRFQRSDGTHLGAGPGQPAPMVAEISIKSR